MGRSALQQLEDLVSDAYATQGIGGNKAEAKRLYDAVRREAAQEITASIRRVGDMPGDLSVSFVCGRLADMVTKKMEG